MDSTNTQLVDIRKDKCPWKDGKCVWTSMQGDDLPCILHDPNPEKNSNKFQKALSEVTAAAQEGDTIHLDGVVFPSDWVLSRWIESTGYHVNQSVSFQKAIFYGEVCFFHEWIEGITFFNSAIFKRMVTFTQCGIKGKIFFNKAEFQEGLLIHDANFEKIVSFTESCFNKEVEIGRDFSLSTSFWEHVSFEKAKFMEEVSFSDVTFKKDVSFKYTELQGRVSFSSIGRVKFEGEVFFNNATFVKEGFFPLAEFHETADFDGATFFSAVTFQEISFKGTLLMGAFFKSQALFTGQKDNKLFGSGGNVSFKNAIFYQPNLVRFSRVDFSKCILWGTDVRGIDFVGVKWPAYVSWDWKPKGEIWNWIPKTWNWLWKRQYIFESKGEPEILESCYRQIRQSYEDRGNYPEAGDFYYGEMEKKRKRTWWRRYLPSLFGLYWISSGYGQKPGQAGLVLMFLLYVFTELFIGAGMCVLDSATVEQVNFEIVLRAYTLKVVTFQEPSHFVPASEWGEYLTVFARLLVPAQAALFALAVNRAFKR